MDQKTFPTEQILCVDETDTVIGSGDKIDVHRQGQLHRAFSILIHDGRGKWLLQKRAKGKYHSGGLWTNTCCGHPRPGESAVQAAERRLFEEMGFRSSLTFHHTNRYRADLDNGMIENEIVHVFIGRHDGPIDADPAEAEDYRWEAAQAIADLVDSDPDVFTYWFCKYVREAWPELNAAVGDR